ncbi:MAG: CaiB/BaiF CoA transferase family protein [Acidimicrobiales bacterium]
MWPLEGIRVLDLSRVLAGPFVGRMLSDLGADVVKVEPPDGDVTRHFGRRRGGQSGYYAQWNAGKRNISIDLRAPDGAEVVRRLATRADVVVENFRPGVLDRYDLGWEALSAANPSLVMLSISGFGQEGPEQARAAYAGIIHAESGWLARQADLTGGAPFDTRLSVADTNAGLHGLVAILAGLRVRDATGEGQHIDLAMIDAFVATDDYAHWALDDAPVGPGGGEVWDTPDGRLIVMGDFRWVWKCAAERLGLADPTPAGASLEEKITLRRRAWAEYVASFTDRAELLAALDRANLAWGVVTEGPEVFASPTLAHRGTLVELDDRAGGTRQVIRSPYRFSGAESGPRGPAPHRGEHNHEVMRDWLDLDTAAVDGLLRRGVLVAEPTGEPPAATDT